MKKSLSAIALLPMFMALNAQAPMNLKQCIEYGLQHHKSNLVHQNNIENARHLKNENVALYFPQIYGDFDFNDFFQQQTVILSGQSLENQELLLGKQYVTTASFHFEQALFDKYLIDGIKGLKPSNALVQLSFQQNQENLIYNISQSYIQVYVVMQQIKLLEENLKKLEQLQPIVKLQVEKGIAKKIDADRITVALNNVRSQTEAAKSGFETAVNKLKYAMGMDLTEEILLSDSAELSVPDFSNQASEFSIENKTEILMQRNTISLLQVQRNRVEAGYYPRLSFYARYSAQSYGDKFSESFGNWFNYYSIGLKLHVPILDGFKKGAQRKQAIININNARLNLEMSENAFRLQYQNAASQMQKNRSSLEQSIMNVALAKEIFDNITLMYREGVSPLSELLNAETSYKEAQLNYITALLNYHLAVLDLEKAKGTIKQYYLNL